MADIETSNITATGNWDLTGGDVKVPAPAVDTDAATKLYVDNTAGTDSNAIHDNVASEISVVTEKASPVSADMIIIEDSADTNNKKMVQIGNLPGAAGGETNTASNTGVAGVGVYVRKTGVDLEFKNINAGSSKITITDDAGNDEIDIDVADANIDHDSLLNFAANEHVDHTAVILTAGVGLSGGGDISVNRTFTVDLNELTTEIAIAAGDFISMVDITDSGSGKITFANFESTLNHDSLTGFVSNEHIDWTGAAAGTIHTDNYVEGGAGTDTTAIHDNTASEISAITEKVTPASGDFLIIEDSADTNAKKRVQVGNLPTGGGGETNTASNTGVGGVGVFARKTGVDLEFKNINAGSNKVTITDDVGNDEIDIDVAEANIDHDALTNTHNLTTSIDHNTITNNHNLTTDIDHNTITNNHNLTTDINHDLLTGFVSNEHIDWTGSSAGTIHTDNYVEGGAGTDTTAIHDNVASEISVITEKVTPASGDFLIIEDSADTNAKKRVQVGNLPTGGGGEANTASNTGVGGVGVFARKTGIDIELKNINTGSNKITITDDTTNDEIDIDVAEANIIHDNLSGFVANEHIDHTSVTFTAGVGLSGGGDISVNRTFTVDLNELTTETTIASGDFISMVDITDSGSGKITFANFEGTLNHDNLSGVVVSEHLDWTSASVGTIHATNYVDNDTTDHTALSNIGTNTHAQIDTHIVNVSNPHSVDASDVSLGNVSNVATDDTAYNSTSWNTNLDSATKNAIRDKVETMDTAIGLNTAKVTNVSTDLSAGTRTATTIVVNSSDGTNATLVEADTTNAGILGSDKWDEIVANTAASHAESHTVVSHSDTTATGAELNTLTGGGDTTLHDHNGISENTSARHTQNTDTALGSGAVAADHGTATTDQVVNVCYGTGATPPTASTTTEGALYVQYIA